MQQKKIMKLSKIIRIIFKKLSFIQYIIYNNIQYIYIDSLKQTNIKFTTNRLKQTNIKYKFLAIICHMN